MEHGLETPMSESVHKKLLSLIGHYLALGGMPEVVFWWIKEKNALQCSKIHATLLDTIDKILASMQKSYKSNILNFYLLTLRGSK